MQRHECNKHNYFIYINNFLEFYFLVKIRVLHIWIINCFPSFYVLFLLHLFFLFL
jgi:hypothetical protein